MDPSRPSEASPRAASITTQDATIKPFSPYLNKHLQARRGYPKQHQARRSDFGPRISRTFDDDIFLAEAHTPSRATPVEIRRPSRQGTPVANNNNKNNNERSAISPERQPKALGTRELDKYIDQLSKLNFDLKMELHHCRERMGKLQEQCEQLTERAQVADEVADKAEQDRRTLLEINDEMIRELEKRDEAVSEAVDIICQLEDQVDVLEQRSVVQQAEIKAHGAEQMLSAEFEADGSAVSSRGPRRRVPSFMLDKKRTCSALRSVYLEPASKLHAVKSHNSLRTQRDGLVELDDMDSPHLSVLSESSFPSIYNPKKDSRFIEGQDDAASSEQTPTAKHFQRENSRTKEWVAESTPLASQHQTHNKEADAEYRYQSPGNQVMHLDTDASQDENTGTPRAVTGATNNAQEENRARPRKDSYASIAKMYGSRELPPTPESASTRLLGQSRSSLSSLIGVPKPADRAPSVTIRPDQMTYAEYISRFSSSEEELKDFDKKSSTVGEDQREEIYPIGESTVTVLPPRLKIRKVSPFSADLLFHGTGMEVVKPPLEAPRAISLGSHAQPTTAPQTNLLPRSETYSALPPLQQTHQLPLSRPETSPNLLEPFARTPAVFELPGHNTLHSSHSSQHRPSTDKRRLSDYLGIQRSHSRHRSIVASTSSSGNTGNGSIGVRKALSNATHKVFGSRNRSVDTSAFSGGHRTSASTSDIDAVALSAATAAVRRGGSGPPPSRGSRGSTALERATSLMSRHQRRGTVTEAVEQRKGSEGVAEREWDGGAREGSQEAMEMGVVSGSMGGRGLRRMGGSRR